MKEMGLCEENLRLPLVPVTKATQEKLRAIIKVLDCEFHKHATWFRHRSNPYNLCTRLRFTAMGAVHCGECEPV